MRKFTIRRSAGTGRGFGKRAVVAGGLAGVAAMGLLAAPAVAGASPVDSGAAVQADDVAHPDSVLVTRDEDGNVTVRRGDLRDVPGVPALPALPTRPGQPAEPGRTIIVDPDTPHVPAQVIVPARPSTGSAG
ncbi:hypothetical protein JK358_11190 [Nocardia sp. 2]|uniref:Uncharacterized protein n=1 Tax=Nocardia acididurans TaxID=2802282 RepID=A0ABS1M2R6_9NOCA|nr:hypothetical protein [Nocardia acididurans]MBL1074957.1 hypothetical protein [Nocardia acididurans]